MISSESLNEIIIALGTEEASIHVQCQRMQSVSRLLKLDRSQSHPERHIGAATRDVEENLSSGGVTGSFLFEICRKVPALATIAVSQLPGSFFKFFFLAFMLDVLKALSSEERSTTSSSKIDDSRAFEYSTELSASSALVLKVLGMKISDSYSPWIQNKSCSLKVNKVLHM